MKSQSCHQATKRRTSWSARRLLIKDKATSKRLSRQAQRSTSPELRVRSILHRLGCRFRVSNRDLPGSPDIANRRRKWVLFVHGCFWHAHRGCHRATMPKRNRWFWKLKFAENRERDQLVRLRLRRLGFKTIVVWECEAMDEGVVAARVQRALSGARGG